MDGLTLFGATAVTVMMLSYALEQRSAWWVLAFAVACAAASTYGWLAGTWPLAWWKACGRSSPYEGGTGGGRRRTCYALWGIDAWTPSMETRKPCPTDVSGEEWAFVAPGGKRYEPSPSPLLDRLSGEPLIPVQTQAPSRSGRTGQRHYAEQRRRGMEVGQEDDDRLHGQVGGKR